MTLEELLSRLAVALGIGLLIGLERHWKTRDDQAGSRAAGLRTFSITGLLGGIAAALAAALGGAASAGGGLFLGLCLVALAGIMTVFARDENRAEKSFSATTAVATDRRVWTKSQHPDKVTITRAALNALKPINIPYFNGLLALG